MKSKIVYLTLALVLVFSLAAVMVPESLAIAADTWYVDGAQGTDDGTHGTGPGTNAFKTIQYSINDSRVGNGDTIIVAAGTYSPSTNGEAGPIVISKSITLLGAQADIDPRPSSGGRSGAESLIDAEETSNAVVQISAADVEINGFTITGGIGDMVEEVGSADRLLFGYNILYDDLGTCSPGDEAIQINYSDGVVIEYNYAYNICEDAFNISYSTNGVIRCNEAHDIYSRHGAIYCYDTTQVDIVGNLLYNVNNGDGIKLGDTAGEGQPVTGIVKCNTVHDTVLNGIKIKDEGSSLTIEKNTIYNAGADGIRIEDNADASKMTIFDNNIYNNTGNGLTNNDAAQVVAENNWWGCAAGPGNPGCDSVGVNVDYDPWLTGPTEECKVCEEGGDGGNGGGGCFIATAAYGTESAAEIDILREFRDKVLLESTVGSQLVEWYYQTSPPVAEFISENDVLKTLVRELVIDPIVSVATFTQGIWED